MTHNVRMLVTLVKVGTHLWVNPVQVTEVRTIPAKELMTHDVEICTADNICQMTDWSLPQVLRALGEGKPDE